MGKKASIGIFLFGYVLMVLGLYLRSGLASAVLGAAIVMLSGGFMLLVNDSWSKDR